MRWWHHAMAAGGLGVAAIYAVHILYPGQLLYYHGPGSPYWLAAILWAWSTAAGTSLGVGAVFWARAKLTHAD